MSKNYRVLIGAFLAMYASFAWSSDACSTRAILAAADVAVSDGTSFRIESYFQSRDVAAIRHVRDPDQIIVLEGPQAWTRVGDNSSLGTNFHKLFALGHQYHAFLLYFDDLVSDVRWNDKVIFEDETREAKSGEYPYGGEVHLIQGEDKARPAGLLFEFPEDTVVSVTFDDWRSTGDIALPFHMRIDDGDRIFDYHYSEIDLAPRSPLWFFEAVSAPSIDSVQVHRLHRKLLAAHCLGDAELIANLSAPRILSANRGDLQEFSRDAMRERFSALFETLNYTSYQDIEIPVIDISTSSDLGWIGVNVRASGSVIETGDSFSEQWAWVMMVKKIDNVWMHAGNASSNAE